METMMNQNPDATTLSKLVADNAKTNKWLSAHFDMEHGGATYHVGIKAFGKWVQRLEINGIVSNVPEQKTLKRLRELVELELRYLVQSNGGAA